jgi:hypothetical protein
MKFDIAPSPGSSTKVHRLYPASPPPQPSAAVVSNNTSPDTAAAAAHAPGANPTPDTSAAPSATAAPPHATATAAPSASAGTPDSRSTTFQAVEGGAETRSGETLMVEAYSVLWVILMGWLVFLWRKQATLTTRLDDLERAIDRAAAKK